MNVFLFWNTLKYLKPVQIYGRIWHILYKPSIPSLPACPLRQSVNTFIPSLRKKKSLISSTRFCFLNQEYDLLDSYGWNDPEIDKLWLYNLHYFDYLIGGDDGKQNEIYYHIIDRWIDENPPVNGNGWEIYPLSLRIVNWIKWILVGNEPTRKMVESLCLQVWYLRRRLEYHLLGNHLLANTKALIFAGLFFDGSRAREWLSKGVSILQREINEQILADGGHFERSPMYHAIILEDLLDLVNIAEVYPGIIDLHIMEILRDKAKRMLKALSIQCHPDGEIAFFNDSAIGIAAKPVEIKKYASRLGVFVDEVSEMRAGCLPNTGYFSVKRKEWFLIIDAAPIGPDYMPGHAHADTLSFELSKAGQRIFVNSGTSCYGISQERLRQRQTPAHNALSVDKYDSSEVWSGFRVARRAKIVDRKINISDKKDVISAAHNGFERLKAIGLHRRTWEFFDKGLYISDHIEGAGTHFVNVFFHFHPGIHVRKCWDGWHIYDANEVLIAKIETDKIAEDVLQGSTYHPEFGISIPNQVLVCKVVGELPLTISTRVVFIQTERI